MLSTCCITVLLDQRSLFSSLGSNISLEICLRSPLYVTLDSTRSHCCARPQGRQGKWVSGNDKRGCDVSGSISIAVIKYPDKSKLEKKGFIVNNPRLLSIVAGKSREQELKTVSFNTSTIKSREKAINAWMLYDSAHFLLTYTVQNPVRRNDTAHSGLGFPPSTNIIKIIPQRLVHRPTSSRQSSL